MSDSDRSRTIRTAARKIAVDEYMQKFETKLKSNPILLDIIKSAFEAGYDRASRENET